jgi:KaiC/GvpD/RAD55 family RecA-like ATPase
LQATKAGVFTISPQAVYIDDMGETKTCKIQPVTVTVRPTLRAKIGEETITVPILPGRVATGFAELDALLYGGIPENYAVLLASPSTDERALLVERFLEAGANTGGITFYITVEPGNAKALAEEHPSNFYLLVCNPQADAIIQNLPNVFKLKGIENLTEIDIALTKAFRMLSPSATGPKRICIEIVSDVLLQHHAVITRKWLSALLPNLKSRGFTVLAVMDPHMHTQEEVQAILGLFEGEIRISEKETEKGTERVLRIRRLFNQKYLESELSLTVGKVE